jgi:Flp pilus assembly protein TadB
MGKPKAIAFHNITNAPVALSGDLKRRQKRYFISMMVRTFCFVLAVILPSPYRWIALAGSLLLPYFAVIMANAGRENVASAPSNFDDEFKSLN